MYLHTKKEKKKNRRLLHAHHHASNSLLVLPSPNSPTHVHMDTKPVQTQSTVTIEHAQTKGNPVPWLQPQPWGSNPATAAQQVAVSWRWLGGWLGGQLAECKGHAKCTYRLSVICLYHNARPRSQPWRCG